jgi:hypothetical protein
MLEEFRKNPHIKIPPKSPCTKFQSPCKFKNPNFNSKRISLLVFGLAAQPTHLAFLAHLAQLTSFFHLQHQIEQVSLPPLSALRCRHGYLRPPSLQGENAALPPLHFPH